MSVPRVGVGVFVWNNQNILLGLRKGSHAAGTWSPPGGKPDPGEAPIQTAARELDEETGLRPRSLRALPFWSYEDFGDAGVAYVTVYFQCVWDGNPARVREPDKCEQWGWFPLNALPYPLFPGVEDAVDWYRSR